MSDEELLIGVDGGATEVRAHEVLVLPRRPPSEGPTLELGPASASCLYDRARGFRPLPIASQLLASERGRVEPKGLEGAQGRLWLEATARAVVAVASQTARTLVRVGVCMPGLKTKDGRGIVVIRNGPRIPDYLDHLQALLAAEGLRLARPITRLSSDGEACAHGEDTSAHGALRGFENAYYIGGGTGIAEALKIGGRILGFDALKGFLRKAWQMEASGGKNVEDLLSPRGMNQAFAQIARKKLPLAPADLPERRAAAGDELAVELLQHAADALAELVVDRMLALRRGLADAGDGVRIPANTILGRVVVGQRLGTILADPDLHRAFRDPVQEALARRIIATGDGALRKHYLASGGLEPGLLAASHLRAAPAIGAAAIEVGEARDGIRFPDEPSHAPF